jgi:hypothetical protein
MRESIRSGSLHARNLVIQYTMLQIVQGGSNVRWYSISLGGNRHWNTSKAKTSSGNASLADATAPGSLLGRASIGVIVPSVFIARNALKLFGLFTVFEQ